MVQSILTCNYLKCTAPAVITSQQADGCANNNTLEIVEGGNSTKRTRQNARDGMLDIGAVNGVMLTMRNRGLH